MKPSPNPWVLLLLPACSVLVCCGTVRNLSQGSVDLVKRSASATVATVSSIPSLLPNGGPKVVEVREKDLKEQPTGKELAQNYNRDRRGGFWFFGGPVNFKEPSLPDAGSEMDGSLLPPRMP